MPFVPRRFLVTGATGFIGSRFVASRLERGDQVFALVRNPKAAETLGARVAIRVGDLAAPESLHGVCSNVDVIVHLASHAESESKGGQDEEDAHRRVTVEGTRHLLAEARAAGVRRFVFMSSVKAMGEGDDECLDETSTPHPVTAYGRAKLAAEMLVAEAGRTGIETCILRLPMVYGPNPKGSLMRLIAAIERGHFPPLPDVRNRRSMIHVDDVVQALSLAVVHEAAVGKLYIVTDGQLYSARTLYVAICRALGHPVPPWVVPKVILQLGALAGDTFERFTGKPLPLNSVALQKLLGSACYRSDRIVQELGFRAGITLERALPEMIAVCREAAAKD